MTCPGKPGLALAIGFIAFAVVNPVHPLALTVFQATCERPRSFSCRYAPQAPGSFAATVSGFMPVPLGGGLAWFGLFWPRKLAGTLRSSHAFQPGHVLMCVDCRSIRAGFIGLHQLRRVGLEAWLLRL